MLKPRTYLQIDSKALVSNFNFIKSKLPHDVALMCVVKADCYGHGGECIKILSDAGAEHFAVSSLDEALEARTHTDGDILILSYTNPDDISYVIDGNIIQTVYSVEYAELLSACIPDGKKLRVHIKIETGMNRLGFGCDDKDGLSYVINSPKFKVEGVFTHFARADERDKTECSHQLEKFEKAKKLISSLTDKALVYHCANSGAILDLPSSLVGMARAGIVLYGFPPSDEVSGEGLSPVMKFVSTVVHIHELKKGDAVSYGGDFKADKKMTVATVACGYGDGISRRFTGAYIKINGHRVRVIGRVCMDHFMVDVTDMEEKPRIGDEAVVFDDAAEYAEHIGTIPYECMCAVSKRVKRIYI